MKRLGTTRWCSALAFVLASAVAITAQSSSDRAPIVLPAHPAWNLPLGNTLTAAPALSGASGYFPIEDQLAAYDLESGTLLWLADVRTSSQPALGNGFVFVVETEALTALRDETGTVAWRVPLPEGLAVPLVWDNSWLIGATLSGAVLAFDARDGRLIWRHEAGEGLHARPALAADRVYLPMEGRIVALKVDTGESVWERRIGGKPNDILALGNRLYVGSTDNYFYCLSTTGGEIDWRWATGADVIGMPMADTRRVYFVSFDNVLRALDLRTGTQRWKRALPLRPTRGPARAGDLLLVSGISPTVFAYRLSDGSPAGEIAAGGELASGPHVMLDAQLPMLVLATRDLLKGTILTAVVRSFEPPIAPIRPLPNPSVPAPPQTPRMPPSH